MSQGFHHGVELVEVKRGSRPITGVRSAVIGLVGTAPVWQVENGTVHRPVMVYNMADAVRYFGEPAPGYTIPAALAAIFEQGAGIVAVVNIFDPDTAAHRGDFGPVPVDIGVNRVGQLPHRGVDDVVVKSQDGATTYTEGFHYTVNKLAGTITAAATAGAPQPGDMVVVNGTFPDPTEVDPAEAAGTVLGDGTRTGLKAFEDCQALFGFAPKIFIAPGMNATQAVATSLAVAARTLNGVALLDVPVGVQVATAIQGRQPGSVTTYKGSDPRVLACVPHVRAVDPATGAVVLEPLSIRAAGAMAGKDLEKGYHWSLSNTELRGVVGLEYPITSRLTDANSEANRLNAAGFLTAITAPGGGVRLWGNRSTAFPADPGPLSLVNVRRTADMLHEAVETAMLQFMDAPISPALVDAITDSVNAFVRELIGRGALVSGECLFDPAKNPAEELAAGRLVFDLEFMPPTPAEKIVIQSHIDPARLAEVSAARSNA